MVPKHKQINLWLMWLLIWPISFWMIYQVWPHSIGDQWLDILAFAVLMCIVAFFPLIINKTPIFFVHGISFAVFLYYGLFIEAILLQIAVLFLMAKLRVGRSELHRLPLNMLMFLFISVLSASVYKLFGGVNGEIEFSSIDMFLPVFAYVITVFISNHLILFLFKRYFFEIKAPLIDKDMIWEFSTTLLILPVGFILYMMYVDYGLIAILFVGIPFVSISFVLQLYHTSEKVNNNLQKVSQIGHELTGQLNVNEVIDLFINRVTDLVSVDYVLIYDIVDKDSMKLARFFNTVKKIDFPQDKNINQVAEISRMVWRNKQGIQYDSYKEWNLPKNSIDTNDMGESMISLPVERENEVVAVITLISKEKRVFEKNQYMILNIVKNYLAVALKNAKNYEETKRKSERDSLTKLYNFRFLENYMETYFDEMKRLDYEEPVSLILIDLDHFKLINDTYGHESGNEILTNLAARLSNRIGDKGIVARYGGEEFVILLPGMAQLECLILAEEIRKAIAEEPFTVYHHILEKREPVDINITSSIGVATYPDNCEDCYELVRHADRAMYVGAKQKGRNKVAKYNKVNS